MRKTVIICNYILMLAITAVIAYCTVYFNNPKILGWLLLVFLLVTINNEKDVKNEEE